MTVYEMCILKIKAEECFFKYFIVKSISVGLLQTEDYEFKSAHGKANEIKNYSSSPA